MKPADSLWGKHNVRQQRQIATLRKALEQIADPSYVGNYSDAEVVAIYRKWAANALAEDTPGKDGAA